MTVTVNQGLIPAKWAALTPDRQALYDVPNDRRVSWRELDEMVRRLANGLRRLGLGSGDRVAMLARNCVEYQALFFAAGRAGLVTQPLNWRLAVPALTEILRDAAPRVVITAAEFADTAAALQRELDIPTWLQFGRDGDGSLEALLESAPDEEPPWSAQVAEDDPFFLLYTGGTTGRSKGALHSHRSAAAGMLNQTVAERIVPSDVYMLTGQMFHIPIVLSMNYMKHGCPVVLVNFEARQALEVIEAERVSAFLGITTMLSWMMSVENFHTFDLSSLRNIQYGGGPMPSRVVRQALESFPCTLIQGYGQTEGATMCFLSQEDHALAVQGVRPERLRSCGREGFVTEVRVVDADGRPVPQDGRTPGEIIVRSPANMLGYFNMPELTAQTLRDGWMWTGDVATWDEDRYVYIVDRAKDMIISGGENVYCTEVEAAIAEHLKVREVAVVGAPHPKWGETPVAVVVPRDPDDPPGSDELIEFTSTRLASYKKPTRVVVVDALPRNASGKVLKAPLRDAVRDDS